MRWPARALLCLLSAVASHGAGVNFPTSRTSASPDFKWVARCETTKDNDGFLHVVLLGRFGSATADRIWDCDRSCDLLWSTDSRQLAITNWTGSNLSEIYLVTVSNRQAKRLDVVGISQLVPKDELEGHCYYEALRWEPDQRLLIRVFGHTDENPSHGFAYYLSVDTQTGSATVLRKSNDERG